MVEIIKVKDILKQDIKKTKRTVTIGNFDGLHLGHQEIIKNLAKEDGLKTVITFDIDPEDYEIKDFKYLTKIDEKIKLLSNYQIDEIIVIHYNNDTKNKTREEFEQFLKEIGTEKIIIGRDFRYGNEQSGDIKSLEANFEVKIIPDYKLDTYRISSTLIKELLNRGLLKEANKYLGYNYKVKGVVVKGNQIGRQIGFPTLNIAYENYKIPKRGVYITKTRIKDKEYKSLTNIGLNPSINLQDELSFETYVLDFNEQVYGEVTEIEFIDFIRTEIKFKNKEELIARLQEDERIRREYDR